MPTQTGSVVNEGENYYFDNDDGTTRQRLSTGGLGGSRPHTDPINTIHLAAFHDFRLEVEGDWEHDVIINVTSIKVIP